MVERTGEIVIAAVERAQLSSLLTAIHRSGFGHLTRVLDPDRGDVAGQARRAGAGVPDDFVLGDQRVAVMISAAARTPAATQLLERQGASRVWTTERAHAPVPLSIGKLSGPNRSRRDHASEPVAD